MKIKLNSPRGPSIVVVVISKFFAKFFHYHKFQRLSNYRRGKIRLNATHLLYWMCQCPSNKLSPKNIASSRLTAQGSPRIIKTRLRYPIFPRVNFVIFFVLTWWVYDQQSWSPLACLCHRSDLNASSGMASTLQQLASSSQWHPSVADHVGLCLERLAQPAAEVLLIFPVCWEAGFTVFSFNFLPLLSVTINL